VRASTDRPGLSDEEAREIAKGLLGQGHSRPGEPRRDLTSQSHQLPRVDEDRVEAALVEMGAVDPETITAAEPDGGAT
jgi:hypothetical protein